ncbi:MAG TPA: phosphoribosylaminoimidazolesuccinocarboxamide synthase [Streptosporangiaceae bacterium]|nr:phosphoribosylaminoimidazolesuccinocarboxamide synthase [Streptosporangiaceae bacterium]
MLTHLYSGKVRELYRAADGSLLLVATDRISAFDYVLDTPIPDKGKILTQLSLWWFRTLADVVPNHVIDAPVPPEPVPPEFAGRAMACLPLSMIPAECVARGYLAGSGLVEYRRDGAVCGVSLPPGLTEGSRLPGAIFTPATKAQRGSHDENISASQLADLVGAELAGELERATLAVYQRGADLAADRGLIVADTKLEFGIDTEGTLRLGDELLTPDSSRFWPADQWRPGASQPSLDKQHVRDWLLSPESGWDPNSGQPPPPLPSHIVRRTREAYVMAYHRITGMIWDDPG